MIDILWLDGHNPPRGISDPIQVGITHGFILLDNLFTAVKDKVQVGGGGGGDGFRGEITHL